YASSPVSIEVSNPDSLIETKKGVLFTYDPAARKVIIQNEQYSISQWVNTPYGTLRFIPQNGTSHGPFYFSLIRPKKGAFSLVSSLDVRSEEHTSELQSLRHLVCR